jgi:hypothetical protein
VGTNQAARSGRAPARDGEHTRFDIIFLDRYGALASAVIYTLLLLLILVLNQERAREAIRALTPRAGPGESPYPAPGGFLIAIALMGLLVCGSLRTPG